jgi:pilus assembly protein Flp/PilA
LAAFVYRADRNAVASTTSHPTITREATAPAMILAFSLVV